MGRDLTNPRIDASGFTYTHAYSELVQYNAIVWFLIIQYFE